MQSTLLLSWLGAALMSGPVGQTAVVDLSDPKDRTIRTSVAIKPMTYHLYADAEDAPAVVVEGDGITVDFAGATLVGASKRTEPDAYVGRGIVVRGKNVTVKNATVRGYKIGIYAADVPGLRLEGCDVSHNYRQRLKSTPEREDLSDWLYGHQNDNNEWLRYGAGIYLFNCTKATVANCRARNGQNGLCLVRCDEATVVDNDMSFLSGWGLAMYRSSRCQVWHNKFDWCMRGYSHGVYSRGQDSTGILIYEQCSDNVFAYNSATHGGDGFFLWAGHETLDRTGAGGCNRNILYRNDFSHAAANGIEATFSDGNVFIQNILEECEHGIWGGYSYNTVIEDNLIRNCRNGISIEHGWKNTICSNRFVNNQTGVHLWWDDDKELLATEFCKNAGGCASRDNQVVSNSFVGGRTAIRLNSDQRTLVTNNTIEGTETSLHLAGDVSGLKAELTQEAVDRVVRENVTGEPAITAAVGTAAEPHLTDWGKEYPALSKQLGSRPVFLPPADLNAAPWLAALTDAIDPNNKLPRGRQYIFIDEWGPYDFTDVRIFPTEVAGGKSARLNVLGPPGTPFAVTQVEGSVAFEHEEHTLPAALTVEAGVPGAHAFSITVEAAGKQASAHGFLLSTTWDVAFYGWSAAQDPRESEEHWKQITAAEPLDRITVPTIDFPWWGGPTAKVPGDHFATVASTTVELPRGKYKLIVTSDDGVRVFIDDNQVLANWTWHAPTTDEAEVSLEAGKHTIRIEHFEIDGYATLQFRLGPR